MGWQARAEQTTRSNTHGTPASLFLVFFSVPLLQWNSEAHVVLFRSSIFIFGQSCRTNPSPLPIVVKNMELLQKPKKSQLVACLPCLWCRT